MKPSLLVLGLVLVLALPAPLRAQQAPVADTPEAAVGAMYAAMQRKDWKAAAAAFDPAALKEFRAMMAPILALGEGQADGQGEAGSQALSALFGGLDPGALKTASDAEFFAAFFSGVIGASGVELKGQQVLGSVPEGEDVRHVVTRSSAAGMGVEMTKMEVVSMRRTAGGWRAMLSGELKGIAEALRMRMQPAAGTAQEPASPAPAD